jgi:DNA-binding CsgD family transcriptional regulator
VYGGTSTHSRTPLIGRGPQLQELERLYAAASLGESALVLLWGEAGIGKTRLIEEFVSGTAVTAARVAKSACFESLSAPFSPVRDVLAALGAGDPFEPQEREEPALASEHARYKIFLRAATLLESFADRPLLMILDDLQWADFATLDFLAFLMPRVAASRILVLGAVRSEHLERDHARLQALTRLTRSGGITLDVPPLDEDQIRRLVTSIWPSVTTLDGEREIERVCALAEGKPYFAEELVASAVSARAGSTLEATPLSIRAGVLARFEALPSQQRDILLVAAVIGRSFDIELLVELTGLPARSVAAALSGARDALLVLEIRERPGSFVFRHAMTREILYRELLAVQARAIHREIAERMERTRDADSFDLAHHWRAAGDRLRAAGAYERAGDAAVARCAHRDAESAYRGAVDSRDESVGATLCEKFSRILSINGRIDDACAFAERAVNGYAGAGDFSRAASLAVRLARRRYESGDPIAAESTAKRALTLSIGNGPAAYDAYVTLAHFEALQGRNDAAEAYLARAESTPGEHPAVDRRNAHMVRAIVAATSSRLNNAFAHYEQAVVIARELDDPEQLAWTLNSYASRAMTTGSMDRARDAYGEAEACVRSREFGKTSGFTIQGLAFTDLLSGDLDAVRARQDQVARLPLGVAMTQTASAALGIRLAFYSDDDAEAARLASPEALELAFASNEAQRIGLLAGCVAAYYDAVGRREDASALRSRALRELRSVEFCFWLLDQLALAKDPTERAQARSLLADAAGDRGNRAAVAYLSLFDARVASAKRAPQATELAEHAAAEFAAIGWPWEQAQALELAGRYAEALEIYRRHGFTRNARELETRRRRKRHRAASRELTLRELEVARLAARGKSNREIAAELFIGERTVETHIAAIFDRFDLTSRRQLASIVERGSGKVGETAPS